MADPVTWAMIAVNVASKAAETVSAVQQSNYEAAVAGQNAEIAKSNASRARLDAGMAEEAQRREARKALGRAAAAGSQAGVGAPGTGSLGASISQGAKEAELDALNIRYGGEMEGFAFDNQAAQFQAERRMLKRRAKGQAISGALGTASAALSGYSDYKYGAPKASTASPMRAPSPRPTTSRRHYSRLPRPAVRY